jgi:AraC family transcriptional regulator
MFATDVSTHSQSRAAFSINETHQVALRHKNRLLAHSDGLNWKNIHVSVAAEQSWNDTLSAIDHYCIAYCLRQSARITRRIDSEKSMQTVLKPRIFGIVPANVASHWDVTGSPEMLLLFIRNSILQGAAEQVFGRDPSKVELIPRLGFSDPFMEQLVLSVLVELKRGRNCNPLYVDTLAYSLAVQLLQSHDANYDGPVRMNPPSQDLSQIGLDRVIEYVDVSLDQNLSIELMAGVAELNPICFARAFRRRMGIAPHQYVLEKRVDRAKELLSSTEMPIIGVALGTGFSSQSHFASAFKRVVGVTPKQYRDSV